ncbi:MAG: HEAT repeat domain-containing protein [Planctomycetes bacterium]|nr:HEAT repeat domain-containing protein [Planctomycetota bacterium]
MHARRLLVLTLAALIAAPSALAQEKPLEPPDSPGTPAAPKPKEKDGGGDSSGGKSGGGSGGKSGPRLRMGDLPEDAKPKEPVPEAPKTEDRPKRSDTEEWMLQLAKWPSAEAKQASIRLAGQPKDSFGPLVAILTAKGADWRVVCGAASTLGKIGDVRALESLLPKLQDRTLFQHAGDLLDAIVRIDPAGAKARLLGQLLHPSSAVVTEAAARLMPRVGVPDAPAIRDVLEAGGPAARAAAVELLVKADPATARTSLVGALRDPIPEVSFAAAKGLASDDSPEVDDLLKRAAASPVDRQIAYAYVALALRGERTGRRTVDDAGVRMLLGGRGLSGVDPLSKAAAACVLADVGYFHDVPLLDDPLDQRIVPELIDVVAGRSFWPDLKTFQALAQRRLQRLTGRSSATTAQEWIAWWQQSANTFHARRVLLEIAEDQRDSFSVTLRGAKAPGAEGTTFAASPAGIVYASPDDFVVMLGATDAQSLASAVNASGILRSGDAGAPVEGLAPLEAVVRSGRRERRISLGSETSIPGMREVLAETSRLRTKYSWQRYRTQTQALDLPSFVALMGPKFADDRSPADRDATRAELITTAIDDARGEAWNLRALEELRTIPDLATVLGDEGVRRLLGRLGRSESVHPISEGIVLALAKANRSDAHPLLLDFLLTRVSPRTHDLMTQVFRDCSEASVNAGLKDERAPVRRAALASLGEASSRVVAEVAAKKALEDTDLGVRREGVRALGRLRCEWARGDLEGMADKPGDLRGAAVEALGRLGGKRALPALMSAFSADDPGLRVAAIEALGATGEPEALSAIAIAMTLDPAAMVREVASRVLVGLGTDRAAAELRRLALDRGQPAGPRARAIGGLVLLAGKDAARDLARLVDDPADEVADTAAVELARWRDGTAVPRLLKMLEGGRQTRAVRTALEGISLETFAPDDAQLVASLYAGWWETSRDRGPRGWLVDALVLQGIDDPALRDWEAARATRDAVPSLLKGLRTDSWAVRRASDLALREIVQRSFGDMEAFTTPSEAARIAAGWEDWWAAETPPDQPR